VTKTIIYEKDLNGTLPHLETPEVCEDIGERMHMHVCKYVYKANMYVCKYVYKSRHSS
jgi:hypothetical protein